MRWPSKSRHVRLCNSLDVPTSEFVYGSESVAQVSRLGMVHHHSKRSHWREWLTKVFHQIQEKKHARKERNAKMRQLIHSLISETGLVSDTRDPLTWNHMSSRGNEIVAFINEWSWSIGSLSEHEYVWDNTDASNQDSWGMRRKWSNRNNANYCRFIYDLILWSSEYGLIAWLPPFESAQWVDVIGRYEWRGLGSVMDPDLELWNDITNDYDCSAP